MVLFSWKLLSPKPLVFRAFLVISLLSLRSSGEGEKGEGEGREGRERQFKLVGVEMGNEGIGEETTVRQEESFLEEQSP